MSHKHLVLGSNPSRPTINLLAHYKRLRKIAIEHKLLTGKSIPGITGEIGEYMVAKILDLELASIQHNPGYDAIDVEGVKYQIKTSIASFNRGINKSKFSKIGVDKNWDILICCILTERYEVICMYSLNKVEAIEKIKHNEFWYRHLVQFGTLIYENKSEYFEK